jgi:hypothetical protein
MLYVFLASQIEIRRKATSSGRKISRWVDRFAWATDANTATA